MTTLTVQQTNESIIETFNSMIENKEYVVEKQYNDQINKQRKQAGYSEYKNTDFVFMKKGTKLLHKFHSSTSFSEIFDLSKIDSETNITFALAFALAFAFAFALSHNKLVLKNPIKHGEIVEIKGEKYKLVLQR